MNFPAHRLLIGALLIWCLDKAFGPILSDYAKRGWTALCQAGALCTTQLVQSIKSYLTVRTQLSQAQAIITEQQMMLDRALAKNTTLKSEAKQLKETLNRLRTENRTLKGLPPRLPCAANDRVPQKRQRRAS